MAASGRKAPDHALAALARAVGTACHDWPWVRAGGTVTEVTPSFCRISGLSAYLTLGDRVAIEGGHGPDHVGEVVRLDETCAIVKPFQTAVAAPLGARVWRLGPLTLKPHPAWHGRIINALGWPIDDAGCMPQGDHAVSIDREPPASMRRRRLDTPLRTGIRALDLFAPLCMGQRIGIFAGSGVGKSTLLGMLARAGGFDTIVIALVGERGREVREFIEDALGPIRARAVCVVATGEEGPMMRRLAPKTALSVAEFFRDRGESVLLIVDSVTRFAHATREVALAAGEAPVARGYPPSTFSELPRLLERAGAGEEGSGSITGIFSVLVDGDDHNDPIADSIRGTLDGHIVLDRAIADQGRFPAIDPLKSLSRLSHKVWSREQQILIGNLRALIARFEDSRDLRLIGGYHHGTDAELDQAVVLVPKIYAAIQQSPRDPPSADAYQEIARSLAL